MPTCGPTLSLVYYRAHIPEETTAMVVKFLLSIYSVNVDKRVSVCSLNQLKKLKNRSTISFSRNRINMYIIGQFCVLSQRMHALCTVKYVYYSILYCSILQYRQYLMHEGIEPPFIYGTVVSCDINDMISLPHRWYSQVLMHQKNQLWLHKYGTLQRTHYRSQVCMCYYFLTNQNFTVVSK